MSAAAAMAITGALIFAPALFAIGAAVIWEKRALTYVCVSLMAIGIICVIAVAWMAVGA